MFDIGFAELLIIGVVALLVIGPERMPEAVRTGAAWLNRLRRGFNDIKREVQQELHNDAVLRDLRDSGRALRDETENLRRQFQSPLEESPGDLDSRPAGNAPAVRPEPQTATSAPVTDATAPPAPAQDGAAPQVDDSTRG
jgi:sec-independent protein translocase protein TatB